MDHAWNSFILEHLLAIHLFSRRGEHFLPAILPICVGDVTEQDGEEDVFSDLFASKCLDLKVVPDIVVRSIQDKAEHYFSDPGIGFHNSISQTSPLTIKEILFLSTRDAFDEVNLGMPLKIVCKQHIQQSADKYWRKALIIRWNSFIFQLLWEPKWLIGLVHISYYHMYPYFESTIWILCSKYLSYRFKTLKSWTKNFDCRAGSAPQYLARKSAIRWL